MKTQADDWERFANPLGFIRLILLVDWDPIVVFGYCGAMDEYDSYAIAVYDLLSNGASQKAVITYLQRIASENMGLSENPEMDYSALAAKLRQVHVVAHTKS